MKTGLAEMALTDGGQRSDRNRVEQRMLDLADQLKCGEAAEIICIVSKMDGTIDRIYFSREQVEDF